MLERGTAAHPEMEYFQQLFTSVSVSFQTSLCASSQSLCLQSRSPRARWSCAVPPSPPPPSCPGSSMGSSWTVSGWPERRCGRGHSRSCPCSRSTAGAISAWPAQPRERSSAGAPTCPWQVRRATVAWVCLLTASNGNL